MSAEKLVDIAEEKGLIDGRTASKLRDQLAEKGNVSPEKVVKLLVKKQKITATQGQMLLEQLANLSTAAASSSDIGLAPGSSPSIATPQEITAPKTPEEDLPNLDDLGADLGPIGDEGLTPLDDDGLTPLDGNGLTPLDDDDAVPINGQALTPLEDPSVAPIGGELTPLSDSSLVPLDDMPSDAPADSELRSLETDEGLTAVDEDSVDDFYESTAAAPKVAKKGFFGKLFGSRTYKVRKNRWDSPLLLLGGGALVILTLLALFLYFVMTRGTGDDQFALAEEDYRSQRYTHAIHKYDVYLNKFPKHPKNSLARCRMDLSRMRQAVESEDWDRSLITSTESLANIQSEEAFPEVMPELSGILPDIYEGFVEQAKAAREISEKESLLNRAMQALALVDNPEFLPTSQRKPLQGRINNIAKEVALIDREIYRDRELQSAISKIDASTTAGKPTKPTNTARNC